MGWPGSRVCRGIPWRSHDCPKSTRAELPIASGSATASGWTVSKNWACWPWQSSGRFHRTASAVAVVVILGLLLAAL